MTGFQWVLLAWWGLGAAATIGQIGKQRPVVTPGVAVVSVAIYAAMAVWTANQ